MSKPLFTNPPMVLLAGLLATAMPVAQAAVTPIADPVERYGMSIQPLFIQAVQVEGEIPADLKSEGGDPELNRVDANMHLELKVHAAEKNPHGFKEGSWIPYLKIYYQITKKGDTQWLASGTLIPMASADGPHYGSNAQLNGPGKYDVMFSLWPPTIPYHTDRETGVTGWWNTFRLSWEFPYFGAGKKGGY